MDDLKINHEELQSFSKKIETDGADLDKIIDDMLKVSEEKLRDSWEGNDADVFYTKIHNYLTRMKEIPQTMKSMSDTVIDIDKDHVEQEDSYGDEFEKEATNYVEDELELENQEVQ